MCHPKTFFLFCDVVSKNIHSCIKDRDADYFRKAHSQIGVCKVWSRNAHLSGSLRLRLVKWVLCHGDQNIYFGLHGLMYESEIRIHVALNDPDLCIVHVWVKFMSG